MLGLRLILVSTLFGMDANSFVPRILSASENFVPCEKSNAAITQISLLSYNILLPNSADGWWCYKMYSPRHELDVEKTAWPFRVSKLREEVERSNCDVVCFQEVSAASFESDFAFMSELGYDKKEMFKKGRFRPATFWRSGKLRSEGLHLHRDRCLVSCFSLQNHSSSDTSRSSNSYVWIANCHLQAGNNADRRLRQIFDCVDVIKKEQNKLLNKFQTNSLNNEPTSKSKNYGSPRSVRSGDTLTSVTVDLQFGVIVTGDMNVEGASDCLRKQIQRSGITKLLVEGEVPAGFVEDNLILTSKAKIQSIGKFIDVYEHAFRCQTPTSEPPPTMVVEDLYGVLTSIAPTVSTERASFQNTSDTCKVDIVGKWDEHLLSELGLHRVNKIFDSFATTPAVSTSSALDADSLVMGKSDVMKWLLVINKELGRGSEYKAALSYMRRVSASHELKSHVSGVCSDIKQSEAAKVSNSFLDQDQAKALRDSDDQLDEDLHNLSVDPLQALPDDGYLTRQFFIDIYNAEIRLGKVWGVCHDLSACGFPIPQLDGKFCARYDHMYSTGLVVVAVRDTGGKSANCLPNQDHPSDHLPIMGVFQFPTAGFFSCV